MKDFSIDKLLNQNLWVECNKTKYCLLMHICEIQKTGTDEPREYLQRRGHPQHKVKIFPSTHVTVADSETKTKEVGGRTKKMAGEQAIRFPRTHNMHLFKKKPNANLE